MDLTSFAAPLFLWGNKLTKTMRIMKLAAMLLLLTCLQVSAGSFAQKVSISGKNMKLEQVFKTIEYQTSYVFFFDYDVLQESKPVNIDIRRGSLDEVLKLCFKDQPLAYNIVNKTIVISGKTKDKENIALPSVPPPVTARGRVTDENGNALTGVSIIIKGTTQGVSTDTQGNFSIETATNAILVFSYVGFTTREVTVTNDNFLAIRLSVSEDAIGKEIVVTALGIKREEKALGYAVQKVSGESLETVKGVDVATSLTGRVSGLVIKNSTEFFAKPSIELRGEGALLVIDGVPYGNMSLRDIPTDDIESLDVLKGPTASALYGSRASGGVLLVTTKKGASGTGLSINVNSNTMFQTGFLAVPKVQSNYGRGQYGQIDNDYVWGPRLNAGNTATDWNPVTKQFEENRPLLSLGKDNLKNFMQTGLITNNNISVAQSGKNGSFRASLNHIHQKGLFPNSKLNMFNFTLGGEIRAGDKFTLESHMGLSRRETPQIWGTGYGDQGYLYQLIMWTGPEYDIRQYRDYWKEPFQTQNWMYTSWYDNPYLIAYEKQDGILQNTINANLTAKYKFTSDLELLVRMGYDVYSNAETWTNPKANIYSTRGGWNADGRYSINKAWGWSLNGDAILSYSKKIRKFSFDAMAGATIYKWQDQNLNASTRNGLTAPTYFSLNGSVEAPTISPGFSQRQVNSLFGRASIGWNNMVFLDFTGRNDWNSSQPEAQRDYFYPSIGSSVVLSEFIKMPDFVDMWKIRASWATFKTPADVYATNRLYSTGTAVWNTLNSANYPSSLLGANLLPSSQRTWEMGTAAYLFNKRLHVDVAYFSKYYFNQQTSVSIPGSSGFSSTLVNTNETYARRGLEITIDGSVIKRKHFEWYSIINWSNQHRYYINIDSVYSPDNPWVKKGQRLDTYLSSYWLTDEDGNVIHNNGMPISSDYNKKYGYGEPIFSFGFMNNFTIGNFLAGINIDGRIGGLMYNYVYDKMFDTGTNPETDNQYRYDEVVNGLINYVGNGVKVISGDVAYDKYGNITSDTRKYAPNDVPVSYQDYAQKFRGGDNGIQKESFFKIREISVGYRIPASILNKSGIKNASVSITAQNVFLGTKFKFSDPDLDTENLNAPAVRMIGFNLKVGF